MMNVMNILIIFGIAAGCIVAERLWPAMKLPRVNAWWGRVILINSIQLGITVLAGQTWNRWLNHWSLLHLRDELSDWVSAIIIYVFSTFVYYWWHRYRHESFDPRQGCGGDRAGCCHDGAPTSWTSR